MDDFSADEILAARPPIASLLSKSDKAVQKLKPGTWQHTMLCDNIRALQLASSLMNGTPGVTEVFVPQDLDDALRAIASMIDRTEKSGLKFSPGTSQHTLQRNRLKALRIAEALVKAQLNRA